jgi:hypothetical protein
MKQECEHTRGQLAEIQRNETTLKSDLTDAQRKVKHFPIQSSPI